MKRPDLWQKSMYDEAFAKATIASKAFARIANVEAGFLIEAMGLARGETLLDVPCGTGRHARVFAKAGIRVTGVDLNPKLIRIARAVARPKVAYASGNMLDLSIYRGKFDAVVNLFTSFGYFRNEVDNVRALREMIAALKPGGRFAIHLIDRDWLLTVFQAESVTVRDGVRTAETRRYDPKSKRIVSRTIARDLKSGRVRKYFHETRLYTKPELMRMLKAAGLRRIQVFGDTDGALYRKGISSHPIYIGWKA
jgi:ubiquinone/menaquinone biosynthesis C-methylase UbiE